MNERTNKFHIPFSLIPITIDDIEEMYATDVIPYDTFYQCDRLLYGIDPKTRIRVEYKVVPKFYIILENGVSNDTPRWYIAYKYENGKYKTIDFRIHTGGDFN